MDNGLPCFSNDHIRNEPAVAGVMVALEAQQARPPFASKPFRLCQFRARSVRCHVLAENHLHPFRMAGAHREPPCLRRAKPLQVDIPDPRLVERRRQLPLRKPRLPRLRHCSDIDQELNRGIPQPAYDPVDGAALVPDRRQIRPSGHQPILDEPPGHTVHAGQLEAVLLVVADLLPAEPASVLQFLGIDGDVLR